MADENATPDAGGDDFPPPKSSSLPGLLAIVNLLAVAGLATFVFLGKGEKKATPGGHGEATQGEAAEEEGEGHGKTATVLYALSSFLVNLSDQETPRYIKLGVTIEIASSDPALAEKIKPKEPILRDLVITTVSAHTSADLRTPQGKQALREQMLTKLGEILGEKKVKKVYFNDFIIQ